MRPEVVIHPVHHGVGHYPNLMLLSVWHYREVMHQTVWHYPNVMHAQ